MADRLPNTTFRPSSSPSYWTLLIFHLTVPSLSDSWRLFTSSKASSQSGLILLILHRSFKAIYGCLLWLANFQSLTRRKHSSELERALKDAQDSVKKKTLNLYRDAEEDETDLLMTSDNDDAAEDGSLISDLAVWRVDWVIHQSNRLQSAKITIKSEDSDLEELAFAISAVKEINPMLCPTLVQCLTRIQAAVRSNKVIEERSKTSFDPTLHQDKLKELLQLFKPSQDLESMPTKGWQQIGFQGADPSTDLRGTGLLGLDALIVFGRYYGNLGQDLVAEAIDGGISWYPWALASINITWWCLSLSRKHGLNFFLLSSAGFSPDLITDLPAELGRFLILQAKLTYLFHHFWTRLDPKPSVMEFEQKFKIFKQSVESGLTKGMIGGLGVGWIEEYNGSIP